MLVFIILAVLLFIIISFGDILSQKVINPPLLKVDDLLKEAFDNKEIDELEYKNMEFEDIKINTEDGNILSGKWLDSKSDSNKVVIICHGFGRNYVDAMKYIKLYLNKDFNILIYNHRHSADSTGKYVTMGYKEKYDLKNVIDYVYNKVENPFIGTHGESMGGATVLLNGCIDNRVKFIVSDCAYGSLKKQLEHNYKQAYNLPKFPLFLVASIITKFKAGFFFEDISTIEAIKKADGLPDIPIMIVHGKKDTFIPFEVGKDIYSEKKSKKRFFEVEDAGHCESIIKDYKGYEIAFNEFYEEFIKD